MQAVATAAGMSVERVRGAEWLPQVAAVFDRHYGARCGTAQPAPGARCCTHHARAAVRLAVVTNKEARYTERVLAAHDLSPLLDRVVSGDTLPRKKPDPPACRPAWATSASRERALFVGDRPSMPRPRARRRVWLLPYGYNLGRPISEARRTASSPTSGALRRALGGRGAARPPQPLGRDVRRECAWAVLDVDGNLAETERDGHRVAFKSGFEGARPCPGAGTSIATANCCASPAAASACSTT